MIYRKVFPALLACFLLSFLNLAFGQLTTGELVGSVYDQTGAVVPGAQVTANHLATGVTATVLSTTSGQYRIPNLAPGRYKLTATAAGFAKAELNSVDVELNRSATANFTLQVGEAATAVQVEGGEVTIDTTTAQISTSFTARQMADLPTTATGSGVINLSLLGAGVSTSGAVGVGVGPSVGGQRPRNNNFTVEGIDNNSKAITGPLSTIPNDAVADFTVLANQFSPEYGHSSGGQFNQVVKSGTNQLHGMLTEYFQNRNLNAADQQNIANQVDAHPRFDDNRFGGNVGGPIRKNKLFFFVDVEREVNGMGASPGRIFAPTQAGYDALSSLPGLSSTNLSVLKQYLPPAAAAAAPGETPKGRYPVIGGKSIELGQVPVLAPNYTNNTYVVGSVDYTIGPKDQLRGRYVMQRNSAIDTGAALPAFYTIVPTNDYLVTFSEFHTFSSSLTNEFRLGYNRQFQSLGVGNQQYPGLDAFPNVTINELGIDIGPDPVAPQQTIQNTYQGTNNLSWTKGAHSLKAGVDFRKYISPQSFTQRSRGDYQWSTLEGFLRDQFPDTAGERTTGNSIYYGDQTQFGSYINDDWKVKPNFTINLGVRYERSTVPFSERSQQLNAISSTPGLIAFNEPQVQNLNFMPRIGLAWSPGKRGATSIRAGFGINYDKLFDNLGILSLPPQLEQTVDVGGISGSNFLANGGIKPNASAGALSQEDARANTGGFIPDQKNPRSIQWNIGVQHVFRQDYTIEVRYLGTRGLFLPIQQRIDTQPVVNAQNALPLYYSMPSQAQLNSLTSTLDKLQAAYDAGGAILPQYLNAGFQSFITAYMPQGNSTYHGLASQVTRRFHNGVQFIGSYTWSHNIDDSTAEVFSTVTSPRRAQDAQNLRAERASSALDHRQRFTFAMLYDVPYFKQGNWFIKNIAGNWELAPIVTYQTGTLATVQSVVDADLNGDSAPDRAILNPTGVLNAGSGVTPLTNSSGAVVAYLVNNP
ncbi:MAG TPA: TonB-dependent receptor, partial [Bryobacteraceae bacterium]